MQTPVRISQSIPSSLSYIPLRRSAHRAPIDPLRSEAPFSPAGDLRSPEAPLTGQLLFHPQPFVHYEILHVLLALWG